MAEKSRFFTRLLVAIGVGAAVLTAPVATAAPECINTGPTTTLCQTSGSAQIVTTPPVVNNYPWYGWPFGGGIVIGFGGW